MAALSKAIGLLALLLATAQAAHLRELLGAEHPQRQLAPTCNIQYNTDFYGNDIKNIPNRPVTSCCDECAAVETCKAWSWKDNVCYLKYAKGSPSNTQGVHSAEFTGDRATCTLETNVDFIDHDIANTPAKYAGACCDICRSWSGCNAFTWSDHNGGTCWLKSGKGNTVAKAGVSSSQVGPNPKYWCDPFQYDTDYVGNDIANVQEPSVNSCCYHCYVTNGCKAWSWSNHNGGTCWLKSGKGATANKAGVISSVKFQV